MTPYRIAPAGLLALFLSAPLPAAEEAAPRCEAQYYESGIEPFGRIVSYRAGQEVRLPDFLLQAVMTATPRREFRVRGASGVDRTLVAPARGAKPEPLEFELDGRHYVLETAHTVLYNRALADDELVVWSREEYRAFLRTRRAAR